jgi:hypothetical protein
MDDEGLEEKCMKSQCIYAKCITKAYIEDERLER